MHHNTYDRFSGCWWGGVIGQGLVNQTEVSAQRWFQERRRIAKILLEESCPVNISDFYSFLTIHADNISSQVNQLKYNSSLLSWLPFIIFQLDKPNLALTSAKERSKSTDYSELLVWSYLLTNVLNHQFDSTPQQIAIEQIINRTQVTQSPVIENLQLVSQEIQKGNSLVQVKEQLASKKQQPGTAIPLAWYCFATTPLDFKLSVQKASHLKSNLGWLTMNLTATLSGAYNGMALISRGWRIDQEQNQDWQLENHLLLKLFRRWLGVYTVEENHESYNLELDAIAPAKFIQPRRHLKIISQSL